MNNLLTDVDPDILILDSHDDCSCFTPIEFNLNIQNYNINVSVIHNARSLARNFEYIHIFWEYTFIKTLCYCYIRNLDLWYSYCSFSFRWSREGGRESIGVSNKTRKVRAILRVPSARFILSMVFMRDGQIREQTFYHLPTPGRHYWAGWHDIKLMDKIDDN